MKIAIDLDGVLFQWMEHWTNAHPAQPEPKTPMAYDHVHELAGLTKAQFWAWCRRRVGFSGVALYPGAAEALARLESKGHTVVLATNRPTWARKETVEAVQTLPHSGLYMGSDKLDVNADMWVDDNPHVIAQVAAEYSKQSAVLMSRPWNSILPLELQRPYSINDVSEIELAASRLETVPFRGSG